ncbi:MAG TPA: hypothetical protein VMF89_17995, partial [Polyangiales bacterium]|nr:hypothetical protein [Polyangiales bacterium]
ERDRDFVLFRAFLPIASAFLAVSAAGCARRLPPPVTPSQLSGSGLPVEEVVHLQGGGEVRGTLIENDPVAGVTLKLQDGTVRKIPASAITYSGQPGTGGLRVTAPEPGTIKVDRYVMGRAPLTAANVSTGQHQVEIAYDSGGSS